MMGKSVRKHSLAHGPDRAASLTPLETVPIPFLSRRLEMHKLTLSAAALAALAAGTAGAAVNNTSVSTSLSLNSTVVGSAGIFANSGISDIGTLMGQVGSNSAIRGKYSAQMVGAAGSGANGGNVYAITVTIGSIATGPGPFANAYRTDIVSSTDTVNGQAIGSAAIAFGAGGGGITFNDFGGANQIYIDNSGTYGDANYVMKINPNAAGDVTNNPALWSTFAQVNSDGSVGFSTAFSANALYQMGSDVSFYFNGNMATDGIRGFNSAFFVEVAAVPAPGAIAVIGLAGLAGRRRRA